MDNKHCFKMNHEEKINNMRIASSIAGLGFTYEQLDLLVSFYELIIKKGDKSNIKDVVLIEKEVEERKIKRDEESRRN